MRLFIALEISSEAKKAAITCQEKAKKFIPRGIRWVPPENLHFTLAFLGEIKPDFLSAIINETNGVVHRQQPFQVELGKPGIFPGFKNARVLWLGVKEGSEAIINLSSALEHSLQRVIDIKKTRHKLPHLTLGRIKGEIDTGMLKLFLESYKEKKTTIFTAQKITLFQSLLEQKGPRYKTFKNFYLK